MPSFRLGGGIALLGVYALICNFASSGPAEEPVESPRAAAKIEAPAEEAAPKETFEQVLNDWRQMGETGREEIRSRMAPYASFAPGAEERAGAHLWMGKDLLEDVPRDSQARRIAVEATAERYLKRAIALDPALGEAYVALVGLWVNQDERRKAIELLEEAVPRLPGLGVKLALLLDGREIRTARRPTPRVRPLIGANV